MKNQEYTRKDAAVLMNSHSDENVRFWAQQFYKSTFQKAGWQRNQSYRGLIGAVHLFLIGK
jgi:hypothetical protein